MTGSVKAYNELTRPLLSAEDREMFEWIIGAILTGGPSETVVIYGPQRSGKTTLTTIVRNILTRFVGDSSPRVVFKEGSYTGQYSRESLDAFVFAETNTYVTPLDDVFFIQTTGERIPVNKYHVLMTQTMSELDAIAEVCISRYRSLGEDHYR